MEVSGFADAAGNIVATRVETTGDSAVARVTGLPVVVDSQTHLNLHVPLGLDVAVKVTGVFDATGTLVARNAHSKVKVK